jgi:DNA repair protein RecO (recombination protein O)
MGKLIQRPPPPPHRGLAPALPALLAGAMEWQDEGLVLSLRPHGEHGAIIDVLTARHGRHLGVVRGGMSRRMQPHLQPGTSLALTWSARLSDHLGTFKAEPLRARSALLGDRLGLAGLGAITAMLHVCLPEREPQDRLYLTTLALVDAIEAATPAWVAGYVHWELGLLDIIGSALDLTSCAVTGGDQDLAFVSPRSGRAVARAAAGDWADRLLPLPGFLIGTAPSTAAAIVQGLTLTGHFLTRGLEPLREDKPLPEARRRLIARLASSEAPDKRADT